MFVLDHFVQWVLLTCAGGCEETGEEEQLTWQSCSVFDGNQDKRLLALQGRR
jgi:hypothetical protein